MGPGNGLLPSGNKPLPEPILTTSYDTIWRHYTTISLCYLTYKNLGQAWIIFKARRILKNFNHEHITIYKMAPSTNHRLPGHKTHCRFQPHWLLCIQNARRRPHEPPGSLVVVRPEGCDIYRQPPDRWALRPWTRTTVGWVYQLQDSRGPRIDAPRPWGQTQGHPCQSAPVLENETQFIKISRWSLHNSHILQGQCYNRMIVPVPVKKSWRIWIKNTSRKSTKTDKVTITRQNKRKIRFIWDILYTTKY